MLQIKNNVLVKCDQCNYIMSYNGNKFKRKLLDIKRTGNVEFSYVYDNKCKYCDTNHYIEMILDDTDTIESNGCRVDFYESADKQMDLKSKSVFNKYSIPCYKCLGSGDISDHDIINTCKKCNGSGLILPPMR